MNDENGKTITSIDVAKLAGVSQATVSRVFSLNSHVSDVVRQRVLEAAAQLRYKPNAIARSLISQKTNIIAFVMENIEAPFMASVLSICGQELQRQGKQIMYFDSRADRSLDETIQRVLQFRVDGLVITSANFSAEMSAECIQMGIPVILFNRYIRNQNINVVCTDNIGAGRKVAAHLLEKNHRHFAYIGGREDSSTNLDRFRGFQDYLGQFGQEISFRKDGNYTYEHGAETMRQMLKSGINVDAVFCANDLIAFGAIDVARFEFNLHVPDDIAIVGFDNTSVASYPTYNLTSVSQPINAMIHAVINILNSSEPGELQSGKQSTMNIFQCELNIRSST